MAMLQSRTGGYIFSNPFLCTVNGRTDFKNQKTQTIRDWPTSDYERVRKAYDAGALVPARSNWENEAIFGWMLIWELRSVALQFVELDSINKFEGLPTPMTHENFCETHCEGCPTDTSVYEGRTIFLTRFLFLPSWLVLPRLLGQLVPSYQQQYKKPTTTTTGRTLSLS